LKVGIDGKNEGWGRLNRAREEERKNNDKKQTHEGIISYGLKTARGIGGKNGS
jgi:hypothetical protein